MMLAVSIERHYDLVTFALRIAHAGLRCAPGAKVERQIDHGRARGARLGRGRIAARIVDYQYVAAPLRQHAAHDFRHGSGFVARGDHGERWPQSWNRYGQAWSGL